MLNREHPRDQEPQWAREDSTFIVIWWEGSRESQQGSNKSKVALAGDRVAWEGTVVEEGDSDLAVGRKSSSRLG